mmetsp:Transcript_9318/g.13235  ORF Transcript_9318/g.13235 Transcript_9318/m.13235 type:complete len:321 (-) Transcript_9318:339-1301(-)
MFSRTANDDDECPYMFYTMIDISGNISLTIALIICFISTILTFLVSSITHNYSQVDKLWSVLPVLYTWCAVGDKRTLIMALVSTVWGLRLSYNFHRRGGYKWPIWNGDEDYRWKYIQDGFFIQSLQNPYVWSAFNLFFISIFQNILLLLITMPSFVARESSVGANSCLKECNVSEFNWFGLDGLATMLVILFIILEASADNQQYDFQKKKYSKDKHSLKGDYADGFCQHGLFSIVRKPNYAAEQAIWISFYLFSIIPTGKIVNISIIGCLLLVMLFLMSGWFTEKISLTKYPKYSEYQKVVPLYIPIFNLFTKGPRTKDD